MSRYSSRTIARCYIYSLTAQDGDETGIEYDPGKVGNSAYNPMAKYRRWYRDGEIYFFTVITYKRQGFLCDAFVPDRCNRAAARCHRPNKRSGFLIIWTYIYFYPASSSCGLLIYMNLNRLRHVKAPRHHLTPSLAGIIIGPCVEEIIAVLD